MAETNTSDKAPKVGDGGASPATDDEINKAIEQASNAWKKVQDGKFVTQNGIVLRLKKVSRNIYWDASRRIVDPPPPMWHDPDKERDAPNPADPEYQRIIAENSDKRTEVWYNTYLALGVEVESMPSDPDIKPIDDLSWSEEIELVSEGSLKIPEPGKITRRLAWLKYHALTSAETNELIDAVQLFSNGPTKEEDVRAAVAMFRGSERRGADNGTSSTTESSPRNNDSDNDGSGS